MNKTDFPEMVKITREILGISQQDLARVLNVSFATINRWENGKTYPNKMALEVFIEFCSKQDIKLAQEEEV